MDTADPPADPSGRPLSSTAASAVAGFDPDAVTGWTLVRAYQVMARRFHETLTPTGLTPAQFGVLLQLAQRPGISQATLARSVFMTPQSMGELLTTLERHGHVQRTPGRRGTPTATSLTDSGRAALEGAVPLVAALNQPAALGLSTAEDTTLNALLHKLRHALHDPS